MLSLPTFEVRIEMQDSGPVFSQLFIGKPSVADVLEAIGTRDNPYPYWSAVIKEHGLPKFHWTDHTRDEDIEYCGHMDVTIAVIRVIRRESIPVCPQYVVDPTGTFAYVDLDKLDKQCRSTRESVDTSEYTNA